MRVGEYAEERAAELLRRAGLAHVPARAVVALLALSVVALVWTGWRWWPRAEMEPLPDGSTAAPVRAVEPSSPATSQESSSVLVHVVGAVRHPGVYTLPADARAADAVQAAGGLMPDAVAAAVNLARPVTDGEQLLVPDQDSVPAGGGTAGGAAAPASGAGAASDQVDLNTADAALLDTLPGIGPSTAERIIADREANGPFASVEDLGRVSGIGPKKLEQLKELACVR